jgi:hypothetical protein
MSERQKAFRALIQQVWTPPPQGIRDDCKAMLGDLAPLLDGGARRRCPQRLFTDEHTAYPQALALVPSLKRDLNAGRLQHITVSSRAPRTQTNPLFPVNYLDRQLRANMAEFARRTIKAGREVNCQMERIAIFMVFHNFLTPHRIHDRVAMDFGYTHAAFAAIRDPEVVRMMERMPTHRHIWGHSKTKQEWIRRIWQHDYRNPPAVQVRDETLSIHSVALPPQGLPAHFLA